MRPCEPANVTGAKALTSAHRIQLISARESSLFLFHAIGKVLYSKRAFSSRSPCYWVDAAQAGARTQMRTTKMRAKDHTDRPISLSIFANGHELRQRSILRRAFSDTCMGSHPDDTAQDLLADLPVDVNMFASYLHQNFPSFVDDVYQSDHALSALSDADCLPGRGDSVRPRLRLGS